MIRCVILQVIQVLNLDITRMIPEFVIDFLKQKLPTGICNLH